MLKNKIALIAGAGSGIGEAIAMGFAEQGAKLVLTDVDQKGGERVIKQVKKLKTPAIFVKADVSVPADCERQVKEAVKAFSRLDIAVNSGYRRSSRQDRRVSHRRLGQGDRRQPQRCVLWNALPVPRHAEEQEGPAAAS